MSILKSYNQKPRSFLVAMLFMLLASWLAASSHAGTEYAREVRVGIYNNKPKIFFNESQKPAGIFVEILNHIAEQEKWKLTYVKCNWQDCLEALQKSEIDLMPDMAYSTDRDKRYDFHQTPTLYSWSQLFRNRNVHIDSTFDLKGKRVAVLKGSIQEKSFGEMIGGFGFDTRLLPVDTYNKAFELAGSGKADAAISNNFFGDLNAYQYNLIETPIVFQPARLYYATSKGRNSDLLSAIDWHLLKWQSDPESEYFQILKKWREFAPIEIIPPYVWQVLGILLTMLLLAGIATVVLRWQVKEKVRYLEAEKSQMKAILDALPDLLFEIGSSGHIYSSHSPYSGLLPIDSDILAGGKLAEVLSAEAAKTCMNAINDASQKGISLGLQFNLESATGRRYFELSVSRKYSVTGSEPRFILLARDISERKLTEAKIHGLVYKDVLTGLPNRRVLMERLSEALLVRHANGGYGALMILDLDHFKTLNDTQGHDIGDQLLIEVAQRLTRQVGTELLVCRLGGDEFVVLMQDMGKEEENAVNLAMDIAEKVRLALNESFYLNDRNVQFYSTTSIGLTLFDGDEISVAVVLKHADVSLYRAKEAGRNTIRVFNPEMQAELEARTTMGIALRQALERAELRIFYQPQVALDGRLIGAEALLRWFPPDQEMVSPGDFIPLAEESGLILPIGKWVLDRVCFQLKAWESDARTRDLSLSVNVSARQFHQPDFVATVRQSIIASGINPARLKLELTESVVLHDLEQIGHKMREINAMGVSFCLDDFGTGYSSLSYLKHLPLAQVKIDQSFVRDISEDIYDAAIVQAILAMSRTLGLQVIAEGVETKAQIEILIRNGCNAFQGYLFGRPKPIDQWESFLAGQAEIVD